MIRIEGKGRQGVNLMLNIRYSLEEDEHIEPFYFNLNNFVKASKIERDNMIKQKVNEARAEKSMKVIDKIIKVYENIDLEEEA